ncbi:MAG TPA: outer membrane lipoprotein chaperone LolA [Burkholderiales bacterium]|nr:outer membrane lipoprotein chaperone LolA [Burkholderiales bacterium]
MRAPRLLAAAPAGLVLALAASASSASSLERFSEFISGFRTARGGFEQKIFDSNHRLLQESRGSLAFSRPGRFRWTYVKPYPQLIVGDGSRVWIYDEDLKQVTVKKLDQALGSTPAALLAGNNDAMHAFNLSDKGKKDGIEWLEALPRGKESSFERIRMGFDTSGLRAMELVDTFGQTTVLRFNSLERNPDLGPGLFRFSPPKGVDVIGDVN